MLSPSEVKVVLEAALLSEQPDTVRESAAAAAMASKVFFMAIKRVGKGAR